jgi:hypothetical protein
MYIVQYSNYKTGKTWRANNHNAPRLQAIIVIKLAL